MLKAFRNFVENIPFYGVAFICTDFPDTENLYKDIKYRKLISFGFNEKADLKAFNVKIKDNLTYFDVFINKSDISQSRTIKNIIIPLPGDYNIRNALGAVAVALELGIKEDIIKKSLLGFKGVERRFSFVGKVNNISIIDDYAHHPTEIKNTISAAKSLCSGKLIIIFEPHRYSRIIDLYDDFINSFDKADFLFVTNIYAAGEKHIEGISKESIIASIKDTGHKNVNFFENENSMEIELVKISHKDDFIVFLGAGASSKKARALEKNMLQLLLKNNSNNLN